MSTHTAGHASNCILACCNGAVPDLPGVVGERLAPVPRLRLRTALFVASAPSGSSSSTSNCAAACSDHQQMRSGQSSAARTARGRLQHDPGVLRRRGKEGIILQAELCAMRHMILMMHAGCPGCQ